MSPRTSSRLAAKALGTHTSDKENQSEQLSSPPETPAPTKGKAAPRTKATPQSQTLPTDHKPKPDLAPLTPKSVNKLASAPKRRTRGESTGDHVDGAEAPLPAIGAGSKRKRALSAPKVEEDDDDELPHNMGKRIPGKPKVKHEGEENVKVSPAKTRTPKSAKLEERAQDATEIAQGAEDPPKKKAKKANPYGLSPGETPFPDWPHPTHEECKVVYDLLMDTIEPDRRKKFIPPDDIPAPSEVVAGCGEVPSILDALIRTLLSAATNGQNSSNAFQGLVKRFGLATAGVGKGSVNWNAVHEASLEDVFDAIKCGGLAKNKSQNIKKILAKVHAENQERLAALSKAKDTEASDNLDKEEKAERELELRALQQGILTLDYYHHLEKDEALSTFTNYPGIGVKTAACVNLFCMQRPCFAVDTHVFRLCQYLGWVPSDDIRGEGQKKADRNTTFSHCEVMIPDELKYGLHQLFLEHGKKCPRCRAITGEKSEGWADANCVIEHLVKRLGAKKGGVDSPKKVTDRKKAKNVSIKDNEARDSDLSEAETTIESSSVKERTSARTKKTTPPRKAVTPKKATSAKKVTKPMKAEPAANDGKATRVSKSRAATVSKPEKPAKKSSSRQRSARTIKKDPKESVGEESSDLSNVSELSEDQEE